MATATSATGRKPSRRSTDRYVGLARSGGNGATARCSRSPRALASLAGVQSVLRQTT